MRRKAGFTLLETLVILAILAILFTIGLSTYRRAQRKAVAREALGEVARLLREGRSLSQRLNVSARFAWPSSDRYLLQVENRTTHEVFRHVERALPSQLEAQIKTSASSPWRTPTSSDSLSYSPPFGETGALPYAVKIRHRRDPSAEACLKVIGVTGKVVIAHACP